MGCATRLENSSRPELALIVCPPITCHCSQWVRSVKKNDYVTFKVSGSKPPRVLCVRIEQVERHNTFADLLRAHHVGKVLPGVACLEDGVRTYHQMANRQGVSYAVLEHTNGVVSLTMTPLSSMHA